MEWDGIGISQTNGRRYRSQYDASDVYSSKRLFIRIASFHPGFRLLDPEKGEKCEWGGETTLGGAKQNQGSAMVCLVLFREGAKRVEKK